MSHMGPMGYVFYKTGISKFGPLLDYPEARVSEYVPGN